MEVFTPGSSIAHPSGFTLEIRKSDLNHPESGYGVFLKGIAVPGTVIGFYPGVVYFADDVPLSVVEGNDYMFSRYDSLIIDGRQWDRLNEKAKLQEKQLSYAAGTTTTIVRA